MKAYSNDGKTFNLTDGDHWIGEIVYENAFFYRAEIKLSEPLGYSIKPVGTFDSGFVLSQGDTEVASLAMTWNGKIVISFHHGKEYALKLSHFFSGKFVVENALGEPVAALEPQFDWKAFHYSYDLQYDITPGQAGSPLLLILCVYAANFFIACMSGANAGMM